MRLEECFQFIRTIDTLLGNNKLAKKILKWKPRKNYLNAALESYRFN